MFSDFIAKTCFAFCVRVFNWCARFRFRRASSPPPPSAWIAGGTRRWHTHRHLSSTHDRIDGHSARVAILILQFMPWARAALLRAALAHDLGEYVVGDMSGPAKRENPEVYAGLSDLEDAARADLGFPDVDLTDFEVRALKLCDRLDAYLWCVHHRPDYAASSEAWKKMLAGIKREARALDLIEKLDEILRGVCDGRA